MADIITREVGATAKGSPLTNAELDSNFINLNSAIAAVPSVVGGITQDMTGFVDRTLSTISFVAATRTFTIAPTGASYDVYKAGTKYTITTSKSLVITNTPGGRYIRYNPTSGNLEEHFSHPVFAEDILVAYISWDYLDSKALVFGDERHSSARDTMWHRHQHLNVGAIWRQGGAATYTVGNNAAMHIGFSTPMELIDEDLTHVITHSTTPAVNYEQRLESIAYLPIIYKSGENYAMVEPTEYPWLAPTNGGSVKYNPLTNGSGALVDSDANKFVVYWIILTNDLKYPVKAFVGNYQHNTLDLAYNEVFNPTILSLPEIAVMYQVVLQTTAVSGSTFKASIAAVRRAVTLTNYTTAVLPTDHANLSNRGAADQHPISSITGLQSALDGKQATIAYTPENAANKGVADGYASLDSAGRVPSTQLPAYVDDVLEYANLASFPVGGEIGKIYVALDTNKTYRWSGSTYIYITSGAVDSVAGKTGVVTLVKADVGLANVDNTADLDKPISTATQSALDNKSNVGHSHTLNEVAITQGLTDPGNDRILFWDDSANTHTYLVPGSHISISGTDLNVTEGSTSQKGVVQLEDSVSSTSIVNAATPAAVKVAWDLANSKANSSHVHTAENITDLATVLASYLLLSGGSLTGALNIILNTSTAGLAVNQSGTGALLSLSLSGVEKILVENDGSLLANAGFKDKVFPITDGAAVELKPNNGGIQTWTLGADRTPTAAFEDGESLMLCIDDGTAYDVIWTSATFGGSGVIWTTDAGVAPTLNLTGYTFVILWKVGSQVYGARVGDA